MGSKLGRLLNRLYGPPENYGYTLAEDGSKVYYTETLEYRTQMQRERRRKYRESGYKRLDIMLSPSLFKKLHTHLEPYAQGTHYGYALVRFLEELEIITDT